MLRCMARILRQPAGVHVALVRRILRDGWHPSSSSHRSVDTDRRELDVMAGTNDTSPLSERLSSTDRSLAYARRRVVYLRLTQGCHDRIRRHRRMVSASYVVLHAFAGCRILALGCVHACKGESIPAVRVFRAETGEIAGKTTGTIGKL